MFEQLTLADLPTVPKGQWFKIEHNAKSQAKPIKVTLMEKFTPQLPLANDSNGSVPSRALGSLYSVAEKEYVIQTAKDLVRAASGYALVVGEYGK